MMDEAIAVLKAQGAVIVDPADIPSVLAPRVDDNLVAWGVCSGTSGARGQDAGCSIDFKYGMKRDFNAWLKSLGDSAPVKTLTELRLWNLAHTQAGALKYGQSNLDISDEMDLERDKPRYEADRAKDLRLAGATGIDAAMATHRLDALLFAAGSGASIAARPGYPTVIVPFGQVPNAPTQKFPEGFNAKPSPYGVVVHRHGLQRAAPHRVGICFRAGDEAEGSTGVVADVGFQTRHYGICRVGTAPTAQRPKTPAAGRRATQSACNLRNSRQSCNLQSAMEDLTTGSLSRHLMKTASFMLVTMVFQTLYFLVDLYWVGRLGKEAVAAVAIAGNLMFVVLAVTQMLGVGTTAMVSTRWAARTATRRGVSSTSPRCSRSSSACSSSRVAMAGRGVYARGLAADAHDGGAGARTTSRGSSRRCRCSSRWWRWARRCAARATSSRAWWCRRRRSSSTSSWRRC